MKKSFKAITLILSLILICSLFTACNLLDNLKEAHAIINEDKSIITYKGNSYLPISVTNTRFNPLTEQNINVTEEDVPVLLSNDRNVYEGEITADGSVMRLNTPNIYYYNHFFCREDRYDEIREMLETEPEGDVYYYSYSGYNDEDKYIYEDYIFTEKQCEAVDEILATVEPVYAATSTDPHETFVSVHRATEDMMFRWGCMSIYKNGDRYIIGDISDSDYCYFVPDEYSSIFEEIMEAKLSVSSTLTGGHYE